MHAHTDPRQCMESSWRPNEGGGTYTSVDIFIHKCRFISQPHLHCHFHWRPRWLHPHPAPSPQPQQWPHHHQWHGHRRPHPRQQQRAPRGASPSSSCACSCSWPSFCASGRGRPLEQNLYSVNGGNSPFKNTETRSRGHTHTHLRLLQRPAALAAQPELIEFILHHLACDFPVLLLRSSHLWVRGILVSNKNAQIPTVNPCISL